jgi:hypothetical protein
MCGYLAAPGDMNCKRCGGRLTTDPKLVNDWVIHLFVVFVVIVALAIGLVKWVLNK